MSGRLSPIGVPGIGPWTAYTPTLNGVTTDPTLSNNASQVVVGAYAQTGKTVIGYASVRFGTAGVNAGSGSYSMTLPVPPVTPETKGVDAIPLGSGYLTDLSTDLLIKFTATALVTVANGGVSGEAMLVVDGGKFMLGTGFASDAVPWTWAASDSIYVDFRYEAA